MVCAGPVLLAAFRHTGSGRDEPVLPRRRPVPPRISLAVPLLGDNGCGPLWGIKRDLPDKVIQWDAEWGVDFEVVGDSPLDVWRAEKQSYEASAGEAQCSLNDVSTGRALPWRRSSGPHPFAAYGSAQGPGLASS